MEKTTRALNNKRAKRTAPNVSFDQVVKAVQGLKAKERQRFLEDLLAATCPEYLDSIREAREDYRCGRCKSHEEVFGV